ncbi:MAG: hypothetical protein UHW60_00690 [Methanobrevibacter sp.]|nr:hypothetical protein [Methanobrevibacter sp.]
MIVILALMAIMAVSSFATATQDFDGLFTMEVPIGEHYSDAAWCYSNKPLGCAKEYLKDDDPNGVIDEDEFAVYYYDNSQVSGEYSNAADYSTYVLTTSFVYKFYQSEGDMLVFYNDIGMTNLPKYVVGVRSDDNSKAVFVGGYDLDNLKYYANTVKFK